MDADEKGRGVSQRSVELVAALALLAFATLLVVDAVRLGIGWADDGPRSGYFPFRIGLALAACSGWLVVRQLMRWSATRELFASTAQLRDVAAVLVPLGVYVASIAWLGIYLPSAFLIAWFMRRQGGYGWARIAPVALGVALALFFLFERWFVQPLPKGPLERWLGF